MHYGQTLSEVHCIVIFACFLIKKTIVDEKPRMTEVPVDALMPCAPMTQIYSNDQQDADDTYFALEAEERSSILTSEVHYEHFKKVFRDAYGSTLGNWEKA